jgi:hypothetical protein
MGHGLEYESVQANANVVPWRRGLMHLTTHSIQVLLDRWCALGTHTLYGGKQGSGLFFQGNVFLGHTVGNFAVVVHDKEREQEQRHSRINCCQQAEPDTAWTLHQ